MSLELAVQKALSQLDLKEEERIEQSKSLKIPEQHGFIDLVRYYIEESNTEHEPISFLDVKPFL